MLGKLILLLLQMAAAWFVTPFIRAAIPVPGGYDLFVYAVLFAIIVYLIGVLGAQVLRDVGMPSTAALSTALIVALIVAALVVFIPDLVRLIPGSTISHRGLVLAGALVGYWVRR